MGSWILNVEVHLQVVLIKMRKTWVKSNSMAGGVHLTIFVKYMHVVRDIPMHFERKFRHEAGGSKIYASGAE